MTTKLESSIFKDLQNSWTPVFTGVTTFYETINFRWMGGAGGVKIRAPVK